MDDKIFTELVGQTLTSIEAGLEASSADIDFELQGDGILEIEFANGSKIIINRHNIAREIWVAARSGGFHFRHDGTHWLDTRDNEELLSKLSRLLSEQAGENIRLV